MKVMNITNVNGLFKIIDSCSGKVELVTNEGDRLNLKSKLSQYVALANVFTEGKIDEMELIAYEPEDIKKLLAFMYNGE
ncbi:polya polymerase [Anaerocolumna sedimenticola]|uniref:Polya polymerase n=1 Tax=Anaerocolumna sedimenticola TaxID=2696063 RepID=A0A6P1TKJ6_9FIRM|nr:polya polymerase [Anaerocolumna sedimenticola]QHQ60436.1 polya polymerase [Anaerocolumna sedimenticola]